MAGWLCETQANQLVCAGGGTAWAFCGETSLTKQTSSVCWPFICDLSTHYMKNTWPTEWGI